MDERTVERFEERAERVERTKQASCLPHFEQGIQSCGQLAKGMSLLMADVLAERVSTSVANAVCNGAGKMLKAVEMQQRYGKTKEGTTDKELRLIGT